MRKPSAALVVASAALVMATIGTSVAATGYLITSSKQIKAGSISLSDLSKSARKELHAARGPVGPEGPEGEEGADGPPGDDGEDGESATNLWAQIKADGSVNASSDGVTAANSSTGVYYVNFGQDITECAALATQASLPNFSGAGLTVAGIPGPAFVAMSSAGVDLAPGFPSVSSATVQTRRTGGALVSTSFAIAVFC
jgi:hypothetical protein